MSSAHPQAKHRIDWSKVACVSLVKNERDVLPVNVSYLADLGARNFLILDNMSTDGTIAATREALADREDVTLLSMDDPEPGHFQGKKLTAAASFAARYFSATWMLAFDADDFFWSAPGPFVDLDEIHADFVSLPWLQVHPGDVPINGLTSFLNRQRLTNVVPFSLPKMLFRYAPDIVLAEGNHGIESVTGRRLRGVDGASLGLAVAHYPIRDTHQFAAKVRSGASALQEAQGLPAGTGAHWAAAARIVGTDDSDGDRASRLFSAFMARDKATLEALCRESSVHPGELAYVDAMVSQHPSTYPEPGRVSENCGLKYIAPKRFSRMRTTVQRLKSGMRRATPRNRLKPILP